MFEFAKSKTDHSYITINPIILWQILALVLSLYFISRIAPILVLLFLAFIVMVGLNPAVNKIQTKLKLPRLFSIVLVYIFFVSAVVGAGSLIIPPLVSQAIQLLKLIDLPIIQEHLSELRLSVTEVGDLINKFGGPANFVVSAITSTFSSLFTFFTLLVMSFYLILDRPVLHRKVVWFTKKEKYVTLAKDFLDSVERQLGGWVRGEAILMTVIGAMTYIGLSLLGVPYALPLAIFAGFLEILPSLGPTIAAIPAIAIAVLEKDPWMGVAVLILYIVVQQLENNFIVPKVMKDNADVNPLIAMISILIGFKLSGVTGGLLAVPTYILLRTIFGTWKKLSEGKI